MENETTAIPDTDLAAAHEALLAVSVDPVNDNPEVCDCEAHVRHVQDVNYAEDEATVH